jgi:hypothetical protein
VTSRGPRSRSPRCSRPEPRGLVDAPGGRVLGAKSEYRIVRSKRLTWCSGRGGSRPPCAGVDRRRALAAYRPGGTRMAIEDR